MLKYHKILILFFLLLVSIIIIDNFIHITIWLYAGVFVTLLGFLAYGSINIGSGFYCRTLCSADTEEKKIALTFDDGPDKTVTQAILGVLKKHNIKAAFFCIGQKAEENPDLVRTIESEGHIIGSHSYSHHFFFDLFSSEHMLKDLQKSENILNLILNRKIKMFRPPYGVTNPTLARAVKKMGYHIVGWSLHSKDTAIRGTSLLIRLKKRVKAGDIIIFHDTIAQTVSVLDKFIIFARENNFCFERPDILLNIEPYE